MTSLAFMFELVPEPVWKTSIGKASSWAPSETAPAASWMADAFASSRMPSSPLARAAAAFTCPIACTSAGSIGVPLMGKFWMARWVCARQRASAGTSTSPMLSCSILTSPPA